MTDSPIPMTKEETMTKEEIVKDDGRTLTYYTFPNDQAAPTSPAAPEAAHV